tara:strand:- start:1342 stop:1542 length:201 start_codon:yes stop_codon:yes gene_type:complete
MIQVGDIVFKTRDNGTVNYSRIGLVLKVHNPDHSEEQFKVHFNGGIPAWWKKRYLHKIEGEKENDA